MAGVKLSLYLSRSDLKVLHIVPGTNDVANGMVVVAKLLAKEQGDAEVVDLKDSLRTLRPCASALNTPSEVWVHGMWLPKEWLACWRALRSGKRLVRMTHGSLSPVYLKYQSPFKKWLVGPIERWCLRRCDRIVATCEAEKGWIQAYLGKRCPEIEVTDIKRFFKLEREFGSDGKIDAWRRGFQPRQLGDQNANPEATLTRQDAASPKGERDSLHILYLGRRHPLKGVEYLEKAVAELNSNLVNPVNPVQNSSARSTRSTRLKIVSNAFGEELEKVWDWCDVLVLPTLSDNFGLVVAEALERGKRVITTDGSPAWGEELTGLTGFTGLYSGYEGRLIYLKGYRDGTDEERVELLKKAIDMLKHDGNMV